MPENTQSQPANSGVATSPLSTGQSLPLFKRTGRPSPFSMEDLNRLVTAINGLLRLKVVRLSSTSTDGTVQPSSGTLTVSDDQDILTLYDADGGGAAAGGSVILLTVSTVPGHPTTPTLFENTVTCQDSGGKSYQVALPPSIRGYDYDGLELTMPDGIHTYGYIGPGERSDASNDPTGSPVSNHAFVWPPYNVGDEIIAAISPIGGTAVPEAPIYVEISPARHWYVRTPICYNGTAGDIYLISYPSVVTTN